MKNLTSIEQNYDKLTEFFESEGFNVEIWDSFDNDFVEISKLSSDGFEFIFTLNPYSKESFKKQVEAFDVEYETKRWSDNTDFNKTVLFMDFTAFHESLKQTLNRLENL